MLPVHHVTVFVVVVLTGHLSITSTCVCFVSTFDDFSLKCSMFDMSALWHSGAKNCRLDFEVKFPFKTGFITVTQRD